MTKGRETKDGRAVPGDRRKAVETVRRTRGGKATTASNREGQLELLFGTAEEAKPANTTSGFPPAMTMEEVATDANLRRAFEQVEKNDGAPGPDRQSVKMVRRHLETILPSCAKSFFSEATDLG